MNDLNRRPLMLRAEQFREQVDQLRKTRVESFAQLVTSRRKSQKLP